MPKDPTKQEFWMEPRIDDDVIDLTNPNAVGMCVFGSRKLSDAQEQPKEDDEQDNQEP